MRFITVTRNNDFHRAYRRGKCVVRPQLVLYVVKNRARCTRVGITTTKKVGNAVVRNRCRRVIRAALAQVWPANAGAVDLIFVARGATAGLKSTQLAPVMAAMLQSAGVSV